MRALVIGGTGPTGPYVIDGLLKRGYQVAILHTGTHEVDLPQEVEHIHGDPHFAKTLEQALGRRTFDLVLSMYGRLRFTVQVLKERVPRFISVGGVGVYRCLVNLDPYTHMPVAIPEDVALQTDIQLDKFTYRQVEAEWAVMEAHRRGYYNATHFRYPRIYGPRQLAPREWSIIHRILDGRTKLILPDGGLTIESRGYAENMAHALLLAVDYPQESAGQIYNVRDEALFTVRAWVNSICQVMNHRFDFVEMPYSLASPARIYSGRSQHRILDISKVQRELSYQDLVPAEEGIRRTIAWYLQDPPPPGGETEQKLRDPFDYDSEDRLINSFSEAASRVKEVAPPRLGFHHEYSHPKEHQKKAEP